jgi:hypothetical protein
MIQEVTAVIAGIMLVKYGIYAELLGWRIGGRIDFDDYIIHATVGLFWLNFNVSINLSGSTVGAIRKDEE